MAGQRLLFESEDIPESGNAPPIGSAEAIATSGPPSPSEDASRPASPYPLEDKSQWLLITRSLVEEHPLNPDDILRIALSSWDAVIQTRIGEAGSEGHLRDLNPNAQTLGSLLEPLFAKKLAAATGDLWRSGGRSNREKDLHYHPNERYSIEMKTSGQLGFKIYGNRSYSQRTIDGESSRKSKSGYYITVNFYEDKVTLVRFGWIDESDWKAQESETGQMAGLHDDTYELKLIPIKGAYTLNSPVGVLPGVGPQSIELCRQLGISTINDVLKAENLSHPRMKKIYQDSAHFKTKYADA